MKIFVNLILFITLFSLSTCTENRDTLIYNELKPRFSNKYMAMDFSVSHVNDTLNLIFEDTFKRFSMPYSDLRAVYATLLSRDFLPEFAAIRIIETNLYDTIAVERYETNKYERLFYGESLASDIENCFVGDNYRYAMILNYILSNITPEEYDQLYFEHIDNSNILVGYEGDEKFLDFLLKYVLRCNNGIITDSLIYKEIRMLGWLYRHEPYHARTELINYILVVCGNPRLDPNEELPFELTEEFKESLNLGKKE